MDLQDKTAIVTGGAAGIGRAIAREFGRAGASVVVGDITEEPKHADDPVPTVEKIRESDGTAAFVHTDVTDEADANELIEQTIETYGGLDILVNNAGVTARTKLHETSADDWDRVMDVNLKGVFHCTKHAIPHLLESASPRVINIASQHGLVGDSGKAAYCTSKGGVVNLTRQLAIDYSPEGITVNAICPGPIKTGLFLDALEENDRQDFYDAQTLTPYLGEPEDIAHAARFLASDLAKYMTGHNLVIEGGYTAH